MNVNLNTLMIIINKPSISFNFVIGRYNIFTFGNMKGFSLHTIMEGFFPISQYYIGIFFYNNQFQLPFLLGELTDECKNKKSACPTLNKRY